MCVVPAAGIPALYRGPLQVFPILYSRLRAVLRRRLVRNSLGSFQFHASAIFNILLGCHDANVRCHLGIALWCTRNCPLVQSNQVLSEPSLRGRSLTQHSRLNEERLTKTVSRDRVRPLLYGRLRLKIDDFPEVSGLLDCEML